MFRSILALILFLPVLASADGYGFQTPSGNIYCNGAVIQSGIDCTIIERSGVPPLPKPASCKSNWGHVFVLDATGPARMQCGDHLNRVSYTDVADYGLTGEFGDITCKSEKTGLTCRNKSGHGFFLSRRQQKLF